MADLSNEDLLKLRVRLLDDFTFYAAHCIRIRTKEGQIAPLVLNTVQRRFLAAVMDQWRATGRVRMVVLKARQQGLSTVISAFGYWWLSQHSAQKGLIMAHESESTVTLFDLYQRAHDNVPAWVKPATKYSSRSELVFKELDSGLRVATAGGRGVARGETLTFQHLSEVAFWPATFADANFNGLSQAVPNADNTFAFVESTANGLTGKFAALWEGAVAGTNEFTPFFSAWFDTPEYREPAPADFRRTPAEEELAARFSLDNDQLYWRRRKIGSSGPELYAQEYPATSEEAFLSTGRPVFNPALIHELLKKASAPLKRMAVDNGSVNENVRGELLVYSLTDKGEIVDPNETYWIGADVGMGGIANGDPSVAQILDSKKRQVAVWRGLIQPDAFAHILSTLGYQFNNAMVAIERNNHGILTAVKLGRDLAYPNTYTEVTEGALEDRDSIQIGLYVTERTKPLIIDHLRAAIRDRAISINDPTTLRELLTFVVTDAGKMEAEGKAKDDCVMSLAIANYVHEGRWTPVEVTDEYYAEAL